jgi:hypothetical protein
LNSSIKYGNIKGSAAEVIDDDRLVLLLIQPVSQRSRSGLVDDTLYIQTGNLARVLGRLALRIVEIRRHSNDRLRDCRPEIIFCGFFQLLQNHCRDFGRGIFLALRHDHYMVALCLNFVGHHLHLIGHLVGSATHEPLDRINRVLWVGNRLALRHLAHQPLTALCKPDDGRGCPATLFIRDDLGLPTLHHCHH